mmetsp:Transcript_15937/g.25451  ORF Transcript_15937/g.25451 Transcript_15937/m.25451 type:complete len:264 (-) Transcript_15937:439-1230(-)
MTEQLNLPFQEQWRTGMTILSVLVPSSAPSSSCLRRPGTREPPQPVIEVLRARSSSCVAEATPGHRQQGAQVILLNCFGGSTLQAKYWMWFRSKELTVLSKLDLDGPQGLRFGPHLSCHRGLTHEDNTSGLVKLEPWQAQLSFSLLEFLQAIGESTLTSLFLREGSSSCLVGPLLRFEASQLRFQAALLGAALFSAHPVAPSLLGTSESLCRSLSNLLSSLFASKIQVEACVRIQAGILSFLELLSALLVELPRLAIGLLHIA